ncbi:outer membrane beta-barrel protein [Mangrovimonas aestuarii]|uniref:outer membrane beta-barrel protein n=1 Tax=Mangrovimonas aestuarii TaxID=3018443 RepID=UPI0023796459|nr:outer membrane beta-barrel protein [Mangrovimonas aestuarii]
MKKNSIITMLLLGSAAASFAQNGSGFGLKGGLNYAANGDYFESVNNNALNPERNLGYHIGVFGKLKGDSFFFKPELVFTQTKSDYDNNDFVIQKLDAPLLVGLNVVGSLNFFAGPSFQYIIDSDFSGITVNNIEHDFTVSLNFGIGIDLKKLGIDLRYERGFKKNEVTFINQNNISNKVSLIDARTDQLILSLSLLL